MTFSIAAVGTREEIRAQIHAASMEHGSDLGRAVQTFLADTVLGGDAAVSPYESHETRYVVEASGHGDAHSVSLTIAVRPMWVPVTTTPEQDDTAS